MCSSERAECLAAFFEAVRGFQRSKCVVSSAAANSNGETKPVYLVPRYKLGASDTRGAISWTRIFVGGSVVTRGLSGSWSTCRKWDLVG